MSAQELEIETQERALAERALWVQLRTAELAERTRNRPTVSVDAVAEVRSRAVQARHDALLLAEEALNTWADLLVPQPVGPALLPSEAPLAESIESSPSVDSVSLAESESSLAESVELSPSVPASLAESIPSVDSVSIEEEWVSPAFESHPSALSVSASPPILEPDDSVLEPAQDAEADLDDTVPPWSEDAAPHELLSSPPDPLAVIDVGLESAGSAEGMDDSMDDSLDEFDELDEPTVFNLPSIGGDPESQPLADSLPWQTGPELSDVEVLAELLDDPNASLEVVEPESLVGAPQLQGVLLAVADADPSNEAVEDSPVDPIAGTIDVSPDEIIALTQTVEAESAAIPVLTQSNTSHSSLLPAELFKDISVGPAPQMPEALIAPQAPVDDPWDQLNMPSNSEPEESIPARAWTDRSHRAHLAVKVGMEHDGYFFTGFSSNISLLGLFVATHQLFGKDAVIKLFFELPGGETITAHADVQWVRDYDREQPELTPGMGLRFTDLGADARAKIQTYIEAHQAEPSWGH